MSVMQLITLGTVFGVVGRADGRANYSDGGSRLSYSRGDWRVTYSRCSRHADGPCGSIYGDDHHDFRATKNKM